MSAENISLSPISLSDETLIKTNFSAALHWTKDITSKKLVGCGVHKKEKKRRKERKKIVHFLNTSYTNKHMIVVP